MSSMFFLFMGIALQSESGDYADKSSLRGGASRIGDVRIEWEGFKYSRNLPMCERRLLTFNFLGKVTRQ
jgi:hypothetical protein